MCPTADKTASLKCQRGEFNLQTASMCLRPRPENFENQLRPVNDFGANCSFQITLLDRA